MNKKKPARLYPKRNNVFQEYKEMYLNKYTISFILLIIVFIIAVSLAMSETSWYNRILA